MKTARQAAVYVRCSTALPTQEKSLDEQLVAIRHDAARQGFEILPEQIYSDYAKSGKFLAPRKGFLQLIEDARSGKLESLGISVLICWAFDRFSRNANDALAMQQELAHYGIRIYSVRERSTADGQSGRWSFVFSSLIAESQSETMSNQNARAHQREAAKGHFWSYTPPYGFKRDGIKPLQVHEEEAHLVRYIYRLYLSGVSLRRIAIRLRGENRRRRNGTLNWTSQPIREILRQDANIGIRIHRGIIYKGRLKKPNPDPLHWTIVPNAHPAIIDLEDFISTQKLLRKKAVVRNFNAVKRRQYLLSGISILRCGRCQGAYNGWGRILGGKDYTYYVCGNRLHNKTCDNESMVATKLDEVILGAISEYANNSTRIEAAWIKERAALMAAAEPRRARLTALDKDIDDLRKRMDRISMALEKGLMSEAMFDRRVSSLESEEKRMLVCRQDLHAELQSSVRGLDKDRYLALLASFQERFRGLDIQEKRHLLSQLIKEIIIHSRTEITVSLRFLTSPIQLPTS